MSSSISLHLWFDKEAKEAAEFYCSVFPESRITGVTTLNDTPSGDSEMVSFTHLGVSVCGDFGGSVLQVESFDFVHRQFRPL
ncbi:MULTISPECIES: VOC family protein [Paenibacillus]|uniref:VOC family protein n=1 Tax=Paenibacillus TaxID=44249 RepID=UPI0004AFD32C|nr:VOC family protein [Paenibacillus sp. J14]